MTRFGPGTYQLVNRETNPASPFEVMVDNEPLTLTDEASVTIVVRNILIATPVPDQNVYKLSSTIDKISGNAVKWNG